MRKWVFVVTGIILILGGVYFGSPFYAVYALKNAAIDGDTDAIESSVDFPSVRESLKSQLAAAMMTKMLSDPEMRNNPFAGLGAAMMPAIVDRMVQAYITPEGVAAIIKGHRPTQTNGDGLNPDMETHTEFVSLDRFRVRLHDKKLNQDGPSFLFERRGFATWKLVKLEIPADALAPGAETRSQPLQTPPGQKEVNPQMQVRAVPQRTQDNYSVAERACIGQWKSKDGQEFYLNYTDQLVTMPYDGGRIEEPYEAKGKAIVFAKGDTGYSIICDGAKAIEKNSYDREVVTYYIESE